jgi:hypothetical protein
MDGSTAVCVIGPGRAGTSMTMRVLNLLGVYAGPEEAFVEPGPGGPKGFWERRDMMKLDDSLLRRHGGSWRNPPRLAPGWELAEELAPEREQARALLAADFAGHPLWGWKNPRVSLTAAFWLRLVPDLRFVVCLRNPIDVAESIAPPDADKQEDRFYYSRRGPERERTLQIWLDYVAGSLVNTSGRPRIFVSYEDHFDARRRTVERLARFVGLEPPPPGGEVERQIDDFIDADLRHHKTAPDEVLRSDQLPPDVASLYLATELLHTAASASSDAPGAELGRLQQAVDVHAQRLLAARDDGAPGVAVDVPGADPARSLAR